MTNVKVVKVVENRGPKYYDQFIGEQFDVLETLTAQDGNTGENFIVAVKLPIPCMGLIDSSSLWNIDEVEVVDWEVVPSVNKN